MSYPGNPGAEPQPPQYTYPENPGIGGYPPPVPQQPMPMHEPPAYSQGAASVPTYQQQDPYNPGYANQYNYGDAPTAPGGQPTMSMPQMSGPPMSGPPMSGPPISGPPVSPYGMPQQVPPAGAKRGVVVPILAGVAVLLLIAAGVMTGLFVNKNNALASANNTIKTRNATVSERDNQLKQLKGDLEGKTTALDKAQQDLRGTQNESDKNKHDKQVVANCLQLLLDALDAANKGDKATFDKKLNDMKTPCAEAQVIMKT